MLISFFGVFSSCDVFSVRFGIEHFAAVSLVLFQEALSERAARETAAVERAKRADDAVASCK